MPSGEFNKNHPADPSDDFDSFMESLVQREHEEWLERASGAEKAAWAKFLADLDELIPEAPKGAAE